VRVKGLEPPRLSAPDPKSGAAAITPHPQPNALHCKGRQIYEIFYIKKELFRVFIGDYRYSTHVLRAFTRQIGKLLTVF
jgi:hypothetical protein